MRAVEARNRIESLIGQFGEINGFLKRDAEGESRFSKYVEHIGTLYRAFVFQAGDHKGDGFIVNLHLVCHLFEDCPIPTGFFGDDIDALSVLPEAVSQKIANKFYWGAGWLEFREDAHFIEFLHLIVPPSKEWLTECAKKMESDPLLYECGRLYSSLAKSGGGCSIDEIEQKLRNAIDSDQNFGKIAAQLYWKQRGEKRWSQY